MKTCILFLVVFCCAALAAGKRCDSNEECESDECCVQIVRFLPSTCLKLKQQGEHCLKDLELKDDRYSFSCPCASGLECKPNKEKDNGIVNFLNDRCQ